jgi:cytochrome bd ubiquinol oxidase subunit II
MIRSLAPIWDGNEIWLVLGGMVLLSAFPIAILHPASGVLRTPGPDAVRFGAARHLVRVSVARRSAPDRLDVRLCRRFVPGDFLPRHNTWRLHQRIRRRRHEVRRRSTGLDHALSIATGLGVVAGYALLGAGWLIWRTDGNTQIFAREIARPALLGTGAAIALVSAGVC